MAERIFPKGMSFSRPHQNAPDFVVGSVGIRKGEFMMWLQDIPENDRGYVNLTLMRNSPTGNSPDGFHFTLDTYQRPQQQRPQQQGYPQQPPPQQQAVPQQPQQNYPPTAAYDDPFAR